MHKLTEIMLMIMIIPWTYNHCHSVAHVISLVGWLKHVRLLSLSDGV